MRSNHLRSVGGPSEPLAAEAEPRSTTAGLVGDPGLEATLQRCARGEPAGLVELRAWQDGRLQTMLVRILGDPGLATRALDRLLAEVAHAGSARREAGDDAEDWLFARLRRHARDVEREAGLEPRLRAVEAPPPAAVQPTESVAPPPAPPPSEPYADPGPAAINHRLRRPRAPVATPGFEAIPAPADRRGRWPLRLGLGLLAGTVGLALALLAVGSLDGMLGIENTGPTSSTVAIPPAPRATALPQTSPRVLLGEPLADREPPRRALAADEGRAVTPAPGPHALAGLRIFVHYGQADRDGAALAARLATELSAGGAAHVEVRQVPFTVVTSSVRYFRADDLAAAQRLTAAIGATLTANGRVAPSTPIDFTDYRPLPQPGTTEIWLPAR